MWTSGNKNFNGNQGKKNEINWMDFGNAGASMRHTDGIG
jgi:hypothetical protein